MEAKAAATSNKRNVIEKEIKKAFYRNENDAAEVAEDHVSTIIDMLDAFDDDELVD